MVPRRQPGQSSRAPAVRILLPRPAIGNTGSGPGSHQRADRSKVARPIGARRDADATTGPTQPRPRLSWWS